MIERKYMRFFLIIFLVFSVSGFAAADCDIADYEEEPYIVLLDEFASGVCLDIENNNTELGKAVKVTLGNATMDGRARALKALMRVRAYINVHFIDTTNIHFENAKALQAAIDSLKTSIINNPEKPDDTLKRDWQWGSVDDLPVVIRDGMNLEATLPDDRCARVANHQCDAEYAGAEDLVRAVKLINAAIDVYTEQYRTEALQDRVIRRTKWDSYYDDLTFQYPWEILFNNLVLEHYDNRTVMDGNKLGFRAVPTSKLVVFHPEVNLVYGDKAEDKFDATVTIEALGYEGFDFDALGKVKNAWGVSLMTAYMDEPYSADSGWTAGLLFKYKGYSIGVTDNHGETGVVLNFNLSQKFFDIGEKSRRYYDEYHGQFKQLKGALKEEAGQIFLMSD